MLRDRIVAEERVYDNGFDDVKADAGKPEVPFDKRGVILGVVRRMWDRNKKYRDSVLYSLTYSVLCSLTYSVLCSLTYSVLYSLTLYQLTLYYYSF
jgi:hypothetical protein